MRIFNQTKAHPAKVNFVDENNVLIGYDLSQCCCENADWFITPDERNNTDKTPQPTSKDVANYSFDPDYFVAVEACDLDMGGMVRFRLVAEGQPDLYLHLYNSHNGYYSHGFDVEGIAEAGRGGSL